MSEVVEKLIAAIVQHGDTKFLMEHPELSAYLSHNMLDASLFAVVDQHVKNHGKVPSMLTLEHEYGQKIAEALEPPSYYLEAVRKNHVRKTLQGASIEAQPFILDKPEQALDIIEKACMTLRMQRQGLGSIDFRDAGPMILANLKAKLSGSAITFGWPTLDNMSGGLMPGDFDVIVGRQGLGKTFALLSRAFHFWENLGLKVAFLSYEMSLAAILERAAAIHSEVPSDYLKNAMFPNVAGIDFKAKLEKALAAAKTATSGFWFFDGNLTAGKEDVYRIAAQLKPDVLCIDAAYYMAGSSFSDRWQRIAESGTFLKLAVCPKVPVLATYQFTARSLKDAKKNKNQSADPDALDIAGSQEIGFLASVILGMYQAEDNPEAINRRNVRVVKGRYGESGSFDIEWNFNKMCFDEVVTDGLNNIT